MDRGQAICQELRKADIRYLAWLCDSETHFMNESIQNDPGLKLVKVCHEGEAVGICMGLRMGGVRAALMVSHQGLFQYGNILKYAMGTEIPLVMLVGEGSLQKKRRSARRNYTVPFLEAYEVKHYLVDSDADVPKVGLACNEAEELRRPVAILLTCADSYEPGT